MKNVALLAVLLRLLPFIMAAVQSVEQFVTATGPEKKAKAIAMVGALLEAAEGASGRDLLDDAVVLGAVSQIIDLIIEIQNRIADRA